MATTGRRVAIFLPALYGGGAERTMLNLAQGLTTRGHRVDLLLARAEGPYLSEVPPSVPVVQLNPTALNAGRTAGSLPGLVSYLRRERPEALLSALHANVVALWARRLSGVAMRAVVNEQNTFSFWYKQLPLWQRGLRLRLVRACYPWASCVAAVSQGVADDLSHVAGLPANLVRVMHNPVITPALCQKAEATLDHAWFRPGEPPVLLAAGRLHVQKDYPTLLRAFAKLRESRTLRLLILGEGPERASLEALVRRLGLDGSVSMPGFVGNPYPYMVRASAYVMSSRWEGLPTVLAEALYCGAPIVSTDCPSGPREILAGGKYGSLVPVEDADALAAAIAATLDGGRRPPPESWQPFDLDTVVDRYAEVLWARN